LIALGSGGSNRLRNAIMMTLCNLIEYEQPAVDAVTAPRVHLESAGCGFDLNIEVAEHSPELIAGLGEIFPKITQFPGRNMFFGGVHTVLRRKGELLGVGDARRGGCSTLASSETLLG